MDQTEIGKGPGVQEFLDCLKESMLLSPGEMERAGNVASGEGANALSVAKALVDSGILTGYQAEAVCNRKQSELRIGNYDVLDRLGAGGMGTVFKARHRRMKRIVAIKVLSRSLAKDSAFVQRFQREVETIARFSHPNIVMAYDADEAEAGNFLVMEFVDGQDLASLVQKLGPLSVADAVDCTLQAARGLEYAHAQGIIHRDIKPANLLRDAAGVVKVTDLGLARLSSQAGGGGAESGSITQAGSVLGTVDYMPPEQAMDSTTIDHRADMYSLGATLFFLLLGRPVYQADTMMAALMKHRLATIPSLVEARSEVPAALDAIFRRLLAKEPGERYATMTEVVRELEAVSASLSGTGPVKAPPATVAPDRNAAASVHVPTSVTATDQTISLKPVGPQSVGIKVLLIELSRTQSSIIRKYLQGQGVTDVVAVVSGQEALKAARTEPPDAIVSALHLPDMTGVELAKQICGEAKAVPGFVLISSEAESANAGSLSKVGKAVYLHKPFTPEQLLQALHLVTERPKPVGGQAPFSAPEDKSRMPKKVPDPLRSRLRVLIVDDSNPARLHVRNVLKELGMALFVEAADGAQAVAALARDSFDLLVTDYNMPFMDGRGLVEYVKQNPATAALPIIMVTTETDKAKLDAVRGLGVAVCDKSFPADVVRKILEECLKEVGRGSGAFFGT